jgi:hypothetical protein
LILVRLLVNFFYLPSLRQGTNALLNLEYVNSIRSITNNEPVYLSGHPFTQKNNLILGPLQIAESEIITAPLLSYFIPYYYTKQTGRILAYEEQMRPNTWYLINTYDIQHTIVDTFFTFQEPWLKQEMMLIRLK